MKKLEETNLAIDWKSGAPEAYAQRVGWFTALRKLMLKLEESPEARKILSQWNVYSITRDDFPRVNIDGQN